MHTQSVPHARSITFLCGRCDHKLKAAERLRGTRVRCTRCQAVLVVPGAPEVDREEEEAGESWWSPLLWVMGGLLGIGLVLIGGVVLLASQHAARKESGPTTPQKPVAVGPAQKVAVVAQQPLRKAEPQPVVEVEPTPKVMEEPKTKPVPVPQPKVQTKPVPEPKLDPVPEPKTVSKTNERDTLGPLPELPPFPEDLAWVAHTRTSLQKAVARYPQDQVSAYIVCKNLLQQQQSNGNALDAAQRDWLRRVTEASRERAVAVLKRDFEAARQRLDLHTLQVVLLVSGRVEKGLFTDRRAEIDRVQADVAAGKKPAAPAWKVTEVRGQRLPSYSESNFNNRVTVNPKPGNQLVRVKARVENVSTTADLPYADWALDFGDGNESLAQPARVLQDNFITLVTKDGVWLPCDYVCERCAPLRRFVLTTSDRTICGGSRIGHGTAFELDLIFSPPANVDALRLVVFGSAPVDVSFSK